jgi:hypothetical protein
MDWHLTILIALLVVVYLAWRRERRANQLARARGAALEGARWHYQLVPAGTEAGRGYAVRTTDGEPLGDAPHWDDDGILLVPVTAGPQQRDALQDPAFEPGSRIQLVTDEPAGGVGVLDNTGTVRAGVLPPELAPVVRERLDSGELTDCVVLWETRQAGERTGIVLLLVHEDAVVEG